VVTFCMFSIFVLFLWCFLSCFFGVCAWSCKQLEELLTHPAMKHRSSSNKNKNAVDLCNLSISHSHSTRSILFMLSADNLRLQHEKRLMHTKTFYLI
jgi:hypothetical protein